MSFNAFKYTRSKFLRDISVDNVPYDVFFNNVVFLPRVNPGWNGVAAVDYAYSTGVTVTDQSSPSSGSEQGSLVTGLIAPISPYQSNYPSMDGIYTFRTDVEFKIEATTTATTSSGTTPALPYPDAITSFSLASKHRLQYGTATIGMSIPGGYSLECWVYVPNQAISSNGMLVVAQDCISLGLDFNKRIVAQYNPFFYSIQNTTTDENDNPLYETISQSLNLYDFTTNPLTTGWHHVALTCNYAPQLGANTGKITLFIDGAVIDQQTDPTQATTYAGRPVGVRTETGSQRQIYFGSTAQITGVRFVAGNPLSTTAFTPPTSKVQSNILGWNGSNATFSNSACVITHFIEPGKRLQFYDASPYRNYVIARYSMTVKAPSTVTSTLTIPPGLTNSTNVRGIVFNGSSSSPVGALINPERYDAETNGRNVLSLSTSSIPATNNSASFTVNFFFYRTGTTADVIWSNAEAGATRIAIQVETGNVLRLQVGTATSTTTARINITNAAIAGRWYYVQLTRSVSGITRTYNLTAIDQFGTVYTGTTINNTVAIDFDPIGVYNLSNGASHQRSALAIGGGLSRSVLTEIFGGTVVDYRVTLGVVRSMPVAFPIDFHATRALA